MTRIYVNTIVPKSGITSVTFADPIAANGSNQWLDRYGIIKANQELIAEDVTIPVGTNGVSTGPVKIGVGCSVTVQGDWRVV